MPISPAAVLTTVLATIMITPEPIAFHIGPIPVFWYGICYAAGLAAVYWVVTREARRRGLNPRLVDNGIIIVGIAALAGGRMYHVIDQWDRYKDNLLAIILPPYEGLGVYGGILTGTIALFIIIRLWKQSFWKWADVIAPGLFVMQAIGRWGNFFNQELYGPPTDLPWGIAIDCAHRVAPYACSVQYPLTQGFQPLFLYESISGIVGAVTLLWLARRYGARMRPGDLFLIWLIWYAVVRFLLETLRTGNWTFFGIPTAMVISIGIIVGSIAVLAWRHRPAAAGAERWGEPPQTGSDENDVETEEDEAGHDEPQGGPRDDVDADGHVDGDEPVDNDREPAAGADDNEPAAGADDEPAADARAADGDEPDPAPVA
jgi:phosphatidylglycerol---prolipoprotein diacylglyceryl transferase